MGGTAMIWGERARPAPEPNCPGIWRRAYPESMRVISVNAQYVPMYVGIDLHKYYMQVAVLDKDGNLTEQTRIPNDQNNHSLKRFLNRMEPGARMVLESSSVWYDVYSCIRNAGYDVMLSNPLKTKAIAYAKIKTDKTDAKILAELLRASLIPACYVPPENAMEFRHLTRHRRYLVGIRTSLKNKIHAILLMRGIRTKASGFGTKHVQELRHLDDYRIDSYLDTMHTITQNILDADKKIERTVREETNLNAKLLSTIPGVGYYSALVIAAEIGDVSRFPDSHRLCSYAGLVPSTHSSGGKTRYGSVTKLGNRFLRSVLSECVLSHKRVRKDSSLSEFHSRIARKKGNPKATVATASKLLRICYWLLKERREYSEEMKEHKPLSRIMVESGYGKHFGAKAPP